MKLRFTSILFSLLFATAAIAGGPGDDGGAEHDAIFATPSKNIFCSYHGGEGVLICERLAPSYFSVDFQGHHSVKETGDRRDIRSEFKNNKAAFVLGYGKSWRSDANIKCTSTKSGLTCIFTTIEPGSGMTISKAGLKTFR